MQATHRSPSSATLRLAARMLFNASLDVQVLEPERSKHSVHLDGNSWGEVASAAMRATARRTSSASEAISPEGLSSSSTSGSQRDPVQIERLAGDCVLEPVRVAHPVAGDAVETVAVAS